jgi:hypothetical protein
MDVETVSLTEKFEGQKRYRHFSHRHAVEFSEQNEEYGQVNCSACGKLLTQLGLMVASPVKFFSTNLVLICHCKSDTSFTHALLPFAFNQIVLIVELVTELSCRASTFTVNGVISPWI